MSERRADFDQPIGGDRDTVPFYPILDPAELGELHDLRDQLPLASCQGLTPDDYVIHIVTPEIITPELPPSAIREIIRLTGAPSLREVGQHGGPVAALASSEHESPDAALRKFEVLHGRDALEIALKLHGHFPDLLQTTLVALAETQGLTQDTYRPGMPLRQEELGRIMLLNRNLDDPIGQKFSDKLGWDWPFYGSIDATPTFISGIATQTLEHNDTFLDTPYEGKDGQDYTMDDALTHSVSWLLHKLDETPAGLLEFKNTSKSGGIDAQAWKDSAFAYLHADGSRANHDAGIASVEVQALAYDALYDAAALRRTQGEETMAEALEVRAEQLRQQIIDTFWIDDTKKGGYFALATDHDPTTGALRPLTVRSSNMGHLLQSRLLEHDDDATVHMRNAVVQQLFSPELLAYSGIRTLASDEAGFRPGGYHTGTVWLWDTARIADGLERHNYQHLAWNLRERIWRTVEKTRSFPEFVKGTADKVESNPSEIYVWNDQYKRLHLWEQPPQQIQGWTVSAMLDAKYRYSEYLAHKSDLLSSPLEQHILRQLG